jgi:quercetin dioxygenase-like cupin family protein
VSQAGVISLHDVDPVELPMGSWSRLLVTQRTVTGNVSTMGYSVFKPGLVAADLSHSVEELAFVIGGRGAVRLEDGQFEVRAGQALFIPARTWHTVVNDGDVDLVMVFSFPSPDYPPTERREPRK